MPRGKSGPRMLSGLNLDNVVADATEESIERESEDESTTDKRPATGRRSLRQGKTDAPIYDMKHHPMDVVTRPNRAATIRHRSKSVSFALDDDDEAESSGVSSGPSDGGDTSDDEESEDDGDADEEQYRMIATPRTPDPRAIRHSARSEARKPINYSKKFHPQDYGLPGYKHRAQAQMQIVTHPQVHIFSSASPKKREHLLPTPEDDGQIDLLSAYDAAREEEEEQERREVQRPRKKLRSLHPNIISSPRVNMKTGMHAKDMPAVPDSDDVEDLVAMALRASQPPPRQPNISSEDNIGEALGFIMTGPKQPIEISSQKSGESLSEPTDEEEEEAPAEQQPELSHPTPGAHKQDEGASIQQPLDENSVHFQQLEDDEEDVDLQDQQPGDDQEDGGDHDRQPQHDSMTGHHPAGENDSGQQPDDQLEDVNNNDQQREYEVTDHQHAGAPASGQQPDRVREDVGDQEQLPEQDDVTDHEHAGAPASGQHPDRSHEDGDHIGQQPEPRTLLSRVSQRMSGLFARPQVNTQPESNQQAECGPMVDQDDRNDEEEQQRHSPEVEDEYAAPEVEDAVTEEEEQHRASEFDEQYAITEPAFQAPEDERSGDASNASDPINWVLPPGSQDGPDPTNSDMPPVPGSEDGPDLTSDSGASVCR